MFEDGLPRGCSEAEKGLPRELAGLAGGLGEEGGDGEGGSSGEGRLQGDPSSRRSSSHSSQPGWLVTAALFCWGPSTAK